VAGAIKGCCCQCEDERWLASASLRVQTRRERILFVILWPVRFQPEMRVGVLQGCGASLCGMPEMRVGGLRGCRVGLYRHVGEPKFDGGTESAGGETKV
jgi:hypothetical protein